MKHLNLSIIFVDTFSSNSLSPLMLLPTRISNSSSTLIDNIFWNVTFITNIISGNFTSTVSDHLPQVAITEDFFLQIHQNLNQLYSLSTLLKDYKQQYYTDFFKSDNDDIKKPWKGIKSIISMKNKRNNDSATSIIHEGNFIADPLSIANVFNDFFSTVAQKVQPKIKFSSKSFSDFLPTNIHESIILHQITEDEISKIISSLNSSKSTDPNSIPTKTLKLLQVQISKHLTDIFNLSFTTDIFPQSLKSAKVNPIQKKPSKLVVSNYRPIYLLLNFDKITVKLI